MSIKTSEGCFRTLSPEAMDSGARTAPEFLHASLADTSSAHRGLDNFENIRVVDLGFRVSRGL
jgi:hypothetical protein